MAIKGHLTVDIELFFTEQDVRNLFDWHEQFFVRICQFITKGLDFEQDYKLGVQQALTSLELFNYLSEVDSARATLFAVCASSEDYGFEFKQKYQTQTNFDFLFN